MPKRAWEEFEVILEDEPTNRAARIAKGAARILGALLEGQDDQRLDVSATHFRVVVRDRVAGTVVHDQDWGGDESGPAGL